MEKFFFVISSDTIPLFIAKFYLLISIFILIKKKEFLQRVERNKHI